jgi:hypothetical protein
MAKSFTIIGMIANEEMENLLTYFAGMEDFACWMVKYMGLLWMTAWWMGYMS